MKKGLKVSIIVLLFAGIVGTSGHFIGVSVSENIRLSKVTDTFKAKLKNDKNYHAKHVNLSFFDQNTNHNLEFRIQDFYLNLDDNNNYKWQGELNVFYDYLEIYSGSAAILDNNVYLKTVSSTIVNENITFNSSSLSELKDSYNNSTLIDQKIFDFAFSFEIFEKLEENLKHIETKDKTTFLFESPLKEYNSTLMFYTDRDCNLTKLKTLTSLEFENTLISIDASNIEVLPFVRISKPEGEFKSVQPLIDGTNDILKGFDIETGKGISFVLGDLETTKPISIYREEDLMAQLLGEFTIFNKDDKDDFIINYNGSLEFFMSSTSLPDVNVDITLKDDVFYISFIDKLNGSLKLSTVEEVFEINKDSLVTSIKSLMFNIVDLIGINHSFNNDYYFMKNLEVTDNSITTSLSLPVQTEEEINKEISVQILYKDSKFEKLNFGEVSYQNYTIKDLTLSLKNEIPEKPIINTEDFRSYDEIIKNLISFN